MQGVYYKITRAVIVDSMEKNDKEARLHLAQVRKYAMWAEKDREGQVPQLTPEQSAQLRKYVLQEGLRRDAKLDEFM